jgi:hypothetical protein
VDELGTSTALGDGTVPAGAEALAHLVVANCPEYAVEIIED